jgi:hypothetical protein
MRRGFKAWCERTSAEYRQSLGLDGEYYFEPELLAREIGVTVIDIGDLPGLESPSIEQLTVADPQSWSAITVEASGHRVTVINPAHSESRRRNSLTHELAHVILNHKLADVGISEEGLLIQQTSDPEQEEEADWLSATLLVPRDLLAKAYFQDQSADSCASMFGVSSELVTWRLRMTGVLAQARRRTR